METNGVKQKYKIVGVSNFDNEMVSDILIAENIPCEKKAKTMCEALNDYSHKEATYFYKVYRQNQELYKFEP